MLLLLLANKVEEEGGKGGFSKLSSTVRGGCKKGSRCLKIPSEDWLGFKGKEGEGVECKILAKLDKNKRGTKNGEATEAGEGIGGLFTDLGESGEA